MAHQGGWRVVHGVVENKKMGLGRPKSCQESKKNWFLEKIHSKKKAISLLPTSWLHLPQPCCAASLSWCGSSSSKRSSESAGTFGTSTKMPWVPMPQNTGWQQQPRHSMSPHLAKYWHTKVKDMLYHPLPWGGIKYRFVWTFFSFIVSHTME